MTANINIHTFMKPHFYTKTVIALALAVATTAVISQAQEQPMPPPAAASALPPNIDPSSPIAQVIKLTQAGVEAGVIRNYIANCPGAFNLDAAKIVELNDVGVPTDIINAMLDHDKNISASAVVTAPPPAAGPDSAPSQDVTVDYFNDTLTPYGSWVVVEGYGRCWRPTTVIYDNTWQPYCDRGHWVYSDCGWYWDSDYSWGVTFHYGRWFRHARYGWCWWPDTVWAPSWVTWRSSSDYCGWAPLPPFTVYRPGIGFLYRGASVAIGFDFGLEASYFTFVSPDRFCDRHPRYYRADHERQAEIFHRTTVINNYNVNNRTIVNGGISVDRFNSGGHRPIQPVAIAQIPNAGRQGWRGNDTGGNGQLRHGPVLRNEPNNNVLQNRPGQTGTPGVHPPEHGSQPQTPNRNLNGNSPAHPQTPAQPGNRNGLSEQGNHSSTPPTGTPINRTPQHNEPSVNTGRSVQQPPNPAQPTRNPQLQSPPTVTPPAAHDPSRRDGSANLGASEHHVNPPAVTPPTPEHSQPAYNAQPNRNPQPQSPPVVTSPRNTAPAQNTPRSSDRGSDRDKQNH